MSLVVFNGMTGMTYYRAFLTCRNTLMLSYRRCKIHQICRQSMIASKTLTVRQFQVHQEKLQRWRWRVSQRPSHRAVSSRGIGSSRRCTCGVGCRRRPTKVKSPDWNGSTRNARLYCEYRGVTDRAPSGPRITPFCSEHGPSIKVCLTLHDISFKTFIY